jgi:hypothetical protein
MKSVRNEQVSLSLDKNSAKRVYVLSALRKLKDGGDKDFFEGGETTNNFHTQAKASLALEDTVSVPFRYKTLYDGLKLNHERNVAVVHPLLFLLRRVLLATTVIYLSDVRHTGLFLYMGYTLFMLGYACIEHQWKDPALNL